ncbi:protein kinase domain-containing protein [Kribbella alba]
MALEDIAGYSLRRGLGSGAAGSVWLLRDLGSGRHAALKRISAARVPAVEEFRRDLALTRSIDFPHLARLLDVRQTDREWLLISQYVAAGTLTNLLDRREPLSPGELVTLLSPLAQALAILHRSGLTHGNVSLANVMFDAEGRPVLTDAGLRLLAAPTPQSAENDLAALAEIARASGGDPRIFTPELFTGDGDEIARRVLRLAAPEPINLGFGDDAPTSTASPSPAETSGAAAHTAVVKPRESGRPGPAGTSLEPAAATDDDAITSGGAISPPEGSGRSLPSSTADAGATVAPMMLEDLYIGAARPGSGVVTPGAEARVVTRTTTSSEAGGSRRTAGRATRSHARNRRRTRIRQTRNRGHTRNRGRRPALGFSARLSSNLRAYGLLAVAGLAAFIVLIFGLITVGVLGSPSSSSASAADNQAATADATVSADATAATPTPTAVSKGTPAGGTAQVTPATPGDPAKPATPATPGDSTTPRVPTVSGDPLAPRYPATPPGSAAETSRWLRALQALDVQRSRTFSTLNVAGLDAIYVPGSAPWKSDKALLTSYRDQQVRIEGLSIQIQSLAVEESSPNTAVLRVVDRLISATAIDKSGRRTPLPSGQPTRRRITLKTTPPSTAWRITEITTP